MFRWYGAHLSLLFPLPFCSSPRVHLRICALSGCFPIITLLDFILFSLPSYSLPFRISVFYVITFYFLIFTPLYACSITVVYLGLEICFIELIYTIYGYYNLISTVDIPAVRSGARDISSGKEPWRLRQRHTVFVDSKTRQNSLDGGLLLLNDCCCPVASVVLHLPFSIQIRRATVLASPRSEFAGARAQTVFSLRLGIG